jgi:hypothetical protein
MPWLWQLVAGLSLWRPKSVHVVFVVDKVLLGQVYAEESRVWQLTCKIVTKI